MDADPINQDSPNQQDLSTQGSLNQNSLNQPYGKTATGHALITHLQGLSRSNTIKVSVDLTLIALAASWSWFTSFGQVKQPGDPLPFIAVVVCARLAIYFALQLHRMSWLHVSRYDVFWLALSAVLGPPSIAALLLLLPEPFTLRALERPPLVLVTEAALYLLLLSGARIAARATYRDGARSTSKVRKVLIVGTRGPARGLASQIQESVSEFELIGFIDDDPNQQGRRIQGLRVLGGTADVPRIAHEFGVEEILIAIAPLPPADLRQMLGAFEPSGLPVRILPPVKEMLIGGGFSSAPLREVQMEDLLPRPEVKIDYAAITGYLAGRTVLVTGGGGSIGSELCRQVVQAGAHRLIVLGRGENSVFEITQELLSGKVGCDIIPVICDVRDRTSLADVFHEYSPQVVFHAAAHKHVPLMEQYPGEAVKNNVIGTLNVVELAVEHKTENFVMVSTDKAVDPCSVMGATKRLGEMIVNGHAAESGLSMVSVRFGNVLGSRGSVVPTMRRQIRQGKPVTVTDPDMVRYFMTIPEASRLILQAGAVGGCGEIYILDMGQPVRILDLAHDLIRLSGLVPEQDIKIKIVGRRPGEKIKEELLTLTEERQADKRGPFYIAAPEVVRLPDLLDQVERLHEASKANATSKVMTLLAQAVPNFHSDLSNENHVVSNGVVKRSAALLHQ